MAAIPSYKRQKVATLKTGAETISAAQKENPNDALIKGLFSLPLNVAKGYSEGKKKKLEESKKARAQAFAEKEKAKDASYQIFSNMILINQYSKGDQ